MVNINKILVPTDFSEFADKALEEALEVAEQFDSKIFLVHAIRADQRFKLSETFDEETQKKIRKALSRKTEAAFQKQMAKFPLAATVEIDTRVCKGVPYREILELEKEIKPDVIVLASQGRSGFEEFFFGSTAEKIVRRSTCSVLIVKDRL
ncbi:MAG: universal stress protein [Desulfosarcina sp.]|jgi:nucleotide-binding universal stress UspA family protein